jgi:hypothetical protein
VAVNIGYLVSCGGETVKRTGLNESGSPMDRLDGKSVTLPCHSDGRGYDMRQYKYLTYKYFAKLPFPVVRRRPLSRALQLDNNIQLSQQTREKCSPGAGGDLAILVMASVSIALNQQRYGLIVPE